MPMEDAKRAAAVPGPQLVRKIFLDRFLSFGPDAPPIPLQRLNVLIGPNGSGKSNLIEALALMRATPQDVQDVQAVVRRGGGVRQWIWKGATGEEGQARIDLQFDHPQRESELWHILQFTEQDGAFSLLAERVHAEPGIDEQRIL